jgi:hypothetical protein
MQVESFPQARRIPPQQQRLQGRGFFRVRRRGGLRQILFLPGAVVKLGLSAAERRLLAAEVGATAAAARHPFWRALPLRSHNLPGAGVINRRLGSVELADFAAVSGLIEERLEASRDYRRQSMRRQVRTQAALGLLGAEDRDAYASEIGDETVPESSAHGDLHFWNFVRADDGYRLIDWEAFDPRGSFAFDYVDFHVAVDHDNNGTRWPETLAAVSPGHHAVKRASRVLGVSPRALAAYYRLIKVDTILRRHEHLPEPRRAGVFAPLLRLLGAHHGFAAGVLALCG